MKVEILKKHKSIFQGLAFDFPQFCVITGKNGSGKSHLLEAMADASTTRITNDSGQVLTKLHYLPFNALNPQIDDRCDPQQLTSNVKNWWNQFEQINSQIKSYEVQGQVISDPYSQVIVPHYSHNSQLLSIISDISEKSKKQFREINEDDIFRELNFTDTSQSNLFYSQIATIFKSYQTRFLKNQFNHWREKEYGITGLKHLSELEFIDKYGQPPWILINEILTLAGLKYKVTSPDESDIDSTYKLRFYNNNGIIDMSVNDLSNGEKVLMSLALAIYNTKIGGSKPDILLIDEPDAPLHPEFSKLLIDTLNNKIVKQSNVCVILTTHSPTTVAMCPDNSIYEIDHLTKILKPLGIARALNILTAGIPHLKVSNENRRQIFVESKYDTLYYKNIFNSLNRKNKFNFDLIFLEPGSGTTNCTDVITVVKKLCDAGSDLVRGIIDYDNKNSTVHPIYVLGDSERYAIENYILDPIFIALALIRARKLSFRDFGVNRDISYVQAQTLTDTELHTIITNICQRLELEIDVCTEIILECDYKILYPNSFLSLNGHVYEQKLKTAFPELQAIAKGNNESALKLELTAVIDEYILFLSKSISATFNRVGA